MISFLDSSFCSYIIVFVSFKVLFEAIDFSCVSSCLKGFFSSQNMLVIHTEWECTLQTAICFVSTRAFLEHSSTTTVAIWHFLRPLDFGTSALCYDNYLIGPWYVAYFFFSHKSVIKSFPIDTEKQCLITITPVWAF